MQLSLFGSTYLRLAKDGAAVPLAASGARFRAAGTGPWVAEASGFNVHAGILVRAGDREGLERLCRYCARPPFSLEPWLRDRPSLAYPPRVSWRVRRRRGCAMMSTERWGEMSLDRANRFTSPIP